MSNAETVETGIAWHYTTSAGLRGIIEANALRASSAAFMNDANEMRTGVRALRSTYERIKSSLTKAECEEIERGSFLQDSVVDKWYLVSASTSRDLLTLWRSYGAGASYAIGFDAAVKLHPIEHIAGEAHPSPPPGFYEDAYDEIDGRPVRLYDPDGVGVFGGSWRTVAYVDPKGEKSHEEEIRTFANRRATAAGSGGFFIDLGVFAESDVNYEKDHAFVDERETRIVVEITPSWKFVQYRESRFGLVPFVELGSGAVDAGIGRYVPRGAREPLPIREVMIGPSPFDSLAAERALRQSLDDRGYGEVTISRSETPFR
ncbi:hypothetical protein [Microbacterium sp. Bi128]|uniref:hypothetical protein n=1 Tax=Microbacterium sp. Bi128 TaxID=2821115 RepID=UPI001DCAE228|nr:hypothetical protein [Microbacterium sp. Bi128]CAH0165130.1 hypothetical protein SRABI128_00891 [Microbacterium sp. Bi128]